MHIAEEGKHVSIFCVFMDDFTLSPLWGLETILLATEEQSDSVIFLKTHRKYGVSLKMSDSLEH